MCVKFCKWRSHGCRDIMDNLGSHRGKEVRARSGRHAPSFFLPKYFPDLIKNCGYGTD
jgi:transposase